MQIVALEPGEGARVLGQTRQCFHLRVGGRDFEVLSQCERYLCSMNKAHLMSVMAIQDSTTLGVKLESDAQTIIT